MLQLRKQLTFDRAVLRLATATSDLLNRDQGPCLPRDPVPVLWPTHIHLATQVRSRLLSAGKARTLSMYDTILILAWSMLTLLESPTTTSYWGSLATKS